MSHTVRRIAIMIAALVAAAATAAAAVPADGHAQVRADDHFICC